MSNIIDYIIGNIVFEEDNKTNSIDTVSVGVCVTSTLETSVEIKDSE